MSVLAYSYHSCYISFLDIRSRYIVSLGGWGCRMLLFRTQIPNDQVSVFIEWDLDTILGVFEENNKTKKLISIYLIVHTVLNI